SLVAIVSFIAASLIGVAAAFRNQRLRTGATATWRRAPEIVLALACAPLLIHDARAMFTGHKAASLPGHGFASAGLVVVGLAGVFLFGRAYRRWLEKGDTGQLWLALLAAAAGAHAVNVLVLVRLYPWFHATLVLVTIFLSVLAIRLRLASALAGSRRAPVGASVVVAALVCALSLSSLPRSQILRFAVYERTAIAGRLLGLAPPSLRGTTVATVDTSSLPERDRRPLPDGPHRPSADILLVTVDALRADHIGAYGYGRPFGNGPSITPNIDALAARATRFARAYAQAPHTSFSIATMLTGKYFATLARVAPGQSHEPAASVLRTYGWKTAAFYPPAVFYIDAEKLKTYAETNFGFEYVKFEYLDAERRVDQILTYYQTVKPSKAFVWVHFFEPHEPYQIHDGFDLGARDIDRYDSEIAYVDAALGRLLAYVKKERPNTIVVLAADHGEEFDEHGGRYHGTTLYEEQLHIPLLIAVPGVAAGTVANQVELVDLTPTLLNVVNIPVPVRMPGTDLGPWLARPPAADDRLPPAFAEVDDRRAVIFGAEKLICDMRGGFCAYYDLARDPGERQNLADSRPDRVAALRVLLDSWLSEHNRLEPQDGPERAIQRGRLNDVSAAADLAVLLSVGDSPDGRREAARLLAGLPAQPRTREALVQAAGDSDPVVAQWASVAAARLGDAAARARVQELIRAPAAEGALRVRGALALLDVGDRAGLALLGESLQPCQDVALCRDVIAALGRLRDPRAIPWLVRALPQVQNRRETVVALGDIGERSAAARGALVDRLESDEYVPVRIEAARALAKLGDPAVAPALERVAARESEPQVAAAAHQAAQQLKVKAEQLKVKAEPPKGGRR
ncbi:MAG TPA: sulfatase-like hydrolase/transferase, partial [Polyangia bacterium]|nr:sulfatase-like hydrolase/transferase [Polyangia bacterium]